MCSYSTGLTKNCDPLHDLSFGENYISLFLGKFLFFNKVSIIKLIAPTPHPNIFVASVTVFQMDIETPRKFRFPRTCLDVIKS